MLQIYKMWGERHTQKLLGLIHTVHAPPNGFAIHHSVHASSVSRIGGVERVPGWSVPPPDRFCYRCLCCWRCHLCSYSRCAAGAAGGRGRVVGGIDAGAGIVWVGMISRINSSAGLGIDISRGGSSSIRGSWSRAASVAVARPPGQWRSEWRWGRHERIRRRGRGEGV